ncbi:MAG: cytochrome c3 family protein [Deltaproteobacteria bacterium]|nr:cytochrome c3 family protein [Deltaproteobacteria bacterium]
MLYHKSFKFFLPYICIGLMTLMLVWGCSSSSQPTGSSREVSNQDAVITFEVSDWPDVTFTHKSHAEYWNNNCMECHMHTDVTDETLWECSECHSVDDAESLCSDDNYGHDCMFVQCVRCHRSLDTDPTPDCSSCHVLTENTGQFVDSIVTGLIYSTQLDRS